jgi:HEAT repeat protein
MPRNTLLAILVSLPLLLSAETSMILAADEEPTYKEKKLSEWVEQLQKSGAGNVIQRRAAALALKEMGTRAKAAADPLAKAYQVEEKPTVRLRIVEALIAIDPNGNATKACLSDALLDTDEEVWRVAIAYFEDLESAELLPALCKALKHKKPDARLAAAEGLAKLGAERQKALPQLGAAWKAEKDPKAKCGLLKALVAIDPTDRATISAVQEASLDANEIVRNVVGSQVDKLDRESFIRFLALKVEDNDETVRTNAASALARLGPKAESTVPALSKALKENVDAKGRLVLLQALIAVDPQSKKSAAILSEVAADKDAAIRQEAAKHLISNVYRDSIPDLSKALEHSSVELRVGAAQALGAMGPKAEDAIPALAKALKGSADASGRLLLLRTVVAVDPESKKSAACLLEASADKDAEVRQEAVKQLIAKVYRDSIPDLSRALQHSSAEMRLGAAQALGALGPKAKDAVPELTKAVSATSDFDERSLLQDALLLISPDALPLAGKELVELLPAEIDMVVSLKVQTLLDSVLVDTGFLKDIRKKLKDECPILDHFQFNPLKDVTVITVASGNIDPTRLDVVPFYFLLNGRFAKEKQYEIAKGRMFGRDGFAACLNDGAILACDKRAALEEAIDHNKNKTRVKPNTQLLKMLTRIDSTQTFWLAKTFSKQDAQAIESYVSKETADKSLGLTLHVNYKEAATIDLRIFTSDPKTASFWDTQVRQWRDLAIELVPLGFPNDPKLADQLKEVLKSAKIETSGSDLVVRFSMKADVLEKIAKRFREQP